MGSRQQSLQLGGQGFFIGHPGPTHEVRGPGKNKHLVDDRLGPIEEVGRAAKIVAEIVVPKGQKNRLPQDLRPGAEGAFKPRPLNRGNILPGRADIAGDHDAIRPGNVQSRQAAVSVAKGQDTHVCHLVSSG